MSGIVVQQKGYPSTSAALAHAVSFDAGTTAGSFIIAMCHFNDGSAVATHVVTTDQSQTLTNIYDSGSYNMDGNVFSVLKTPTAGTVQITFTGSVSCHKTIWIVEVSGLDSSGTTYSAVNEITNQVPSGPNYDWTGPAISAAKDCWALGFCSFPTGTNPGDGVASNWTAAAGTGITSVGTVVNATEGDTMQVVYGNFSAGTVTSGGSFPDAPSTPSLYTWAFDITGGQLLSPTSDITAGSWVPSTGGTLYGTIDETTASDTDYDFCGNAAGSTMEVKFASAGDPQSSAGHIVHYRIMGLGGTLTVSLRQGASTEIASWTHNPPPVTPTTYDQTLSGAQVDAITDYTDLRLRFVAAP